MSKQVELKGDNLIVHTRENYKQVSRVIVLHKGDTAKAFYPYLPSYINDIEVFKDWTICGYRVEDLYKLALILRDRKVEDINLENYNQSFFDGYAKAQEDINNSIEASINKMMADIHNLEA